MLINMVKHGVSDSQNYLSSHMRAFLDTKNKGIAFWEKTVHGLDEGKDPQA